MHGVSTIHASGGSGMTQRWAPRAPDAMSLGQSYITSKMRRLPRVVFPLCVLLAGSATALAAQAPLRSRWQDSLPPRAFYRLAALAKQTDSVEARSAEWRAWAAAAPTQAAPRLALAMLSRFDSRYADAGAWLDSATRVATTPVWRTAVLRERVGALLSRGEFTGVREMLQGIVADSASLPQGEWAESKFVRLAFERRTRGRVTLAGIDSVSSATPANDTILRARLACLRAVADRPRMMQHAEEAIALATGANALFIRANCELVVGSLLSQAGEVGQALLWYLRAEETARTARDFPTLAGALQLHGYTLRTVGYIRSSRMRLTEAIRVAQRIDDRNIEAWSLLNVAATARQIGDAATMSSALRRALLLFEATGDRIGYEESLLEQAMSFIMLGDLVQAEKVAVRGRIMGDSLGVRQMVLRSLYMQSDIAVRTGRLDEATTLLDSASKVVTTLGEAWRMQLQEYRGLLALRRGKQEDAIRILDEVKKGYLANGQDLFRYDVDGALALAWLQLGDSVRAERTLIEANRDLDAARDSLAESGLRKVLTAVDAWGGTNGNVDKVLAAFVQSPRWLPTVFSVTERARSRALLNGVLGAETTSDSTSINEARRRVRAGASVLADVQKSLKPTTALLVYAGGGASARTSLMIITNRSARGITLPPMDSLDREIVRWLALMESGETGAGAGRQVSSSVLSTALRGLPSSIKRLVIVPHGPLYRVPFQALPVGNGVLGDRAVVTISPSVSLALAYAAEPRSVPARVLALGAGDTEITSAIPQSLEINVERSERGNPLAPLLAAADEARAAAGWGTESLALTGVDASEAALKRAARGPYTVLHAAAHALTSDQTLGANYLILRADSSDDGYVSGGELAQLSVGRAMVVLSGCRTTGDFGSRGDAIDGLVAPLLARGVRTVVASHWAVSDRWTKVLMERFYQQLAAGATTAEAMNTAQTSLRRAGVPARFWAAFSVIGDGALTFSPVTPVGGGR